MLVLNRKMRYNYILYVRRNDHLNTVHQPVVLTSRQYLYHTRIFHRADTVLSPAQQRAKIQLSFGQITQGTCPALHRVRIQKNVDYLRRPVKGPLETGRLGVALDTTQYHNLLLTTCTVLELLLPCAHGGNCQGHMTRVSGEIRTQLTSHTVSFYKDIRYIYALYPCKTVIDYINIQYIIFFIRKVNLQTYIEQIIKEVFSLHHRTFSSHIASENFYYYNTIRGLMQSSAAGMTQQKAELQGTIQHRQ